VSANPLATLISLHGRTAVVTGAAQGFGAAIATRLAEAGARVVVADRDVEGAKAQAGALVEAGGLAEPAEVDVADERAVAALFELAGQVDIVVNNAGVFSNAMATDLRVAEFDRIMSVNVRGTFLCSREFARRTLADGRGGAIVNIASVDALAASCEGQVHYTASKHAIAGLTKSLSVELAPHGIRVNAVCPGAAMTEGAIAFVQAGAPDGIDLAAQWAGIADRTPLGRLVEPDHVALAVVFLASDLATSITGVLLPVDGGILTQPLEGYTGQAMP
jgi:NAD(P)-dependent dehydrogenase (short-subunit alcohol dehydrogenase family)